MERINESKLMKICFLAPSNSAHTKKWCEYFASQGHEVHVISFCDEEIEGVHLHYVSTGANAGVGDVQKLKYLLQAGKVRRIVKEIGPDIVNAHYATSYGTVAALAGLKNSIVSVWGSDIYVFPKKSPLHRLLLKFSLARASTFSLQARLWRRKQVSIPGSLSRSRPLASIWPCFPLKSAAVRMRGILWWAR